MKRRMWTTSEIQTLREMRTKGISFFEISCAVNHSVNSCIKTANKFFILKPKKPVVKETKINTGSEDIKICTYQSCRELFERVPGTPKGNWDQMTRCPKCRKRANRKRALTTGTKHDPTMGNYEVRSKILDMFLYRFHLTTQVGGVSLNEESFHSA